MFLVSCVHVAVWSPMSNKNNLRKRPKYRMGLKKYFTSSSSTACGAGVLLTSRLRRAPEPLVLLIATLAANVSKQCLVFQDVSAKTSFAKSQA